MIKAKVSTWFASAANKMDACGLFVFVVGVILRFVDYERFSPGGRFPLFVPLSYLLNHTIFKPKVVFRKSYIQVILKAVLSYLELFEKNCHEP